MNASDAPCSLGPFHLTAIDPPKQLRLQEDHEFQLRLELDPAATAPVLLKAIAIEDTKGTLTTPHCSSEQFFTPGTVFTTTCRLRATHSGQLNLGTINAQVMTADEKHHARVKLEHDPIPVVPELLSLQCVHVDAEIVRSRDGVFKTRVQIASTGTEKVENLELCFDSDEWVSGTKRLRFADFGSLTSTRELFVFTRSTSLSISARARLNDRLVKDQHTLELDVPDTKQARFVFLAPRKFTERLDLFSFVSREGRKVQPVSGEFPLQSDARYVLRVHDADHAIEDFRIEQSWWYTWGFRAQRGDHQEFEVSVKSRKAMSTPVLLHYSYNVRSLRGDIERVHGEIPVRLEPLSYAHAKIAMTLCAAPTIEGAAALAGLIGRSKTFSWIAMSQAMSQVFTWTHFRATFLLSFPLVWSLLKVWNWISYRFGYGRLVRKQQQAEH